MVSIVLLSLIICLINASSLSIALKLATRLYRNTIPSFKLSLITLIMGDKQPIYSLILNFLVLIRYELYVMLFISTYCCLNVSKTRIIYPFCSR